MELSINDLKCLIGSNSSERSFPFAVGDPVFIRCITYHYTGRICSISGDFVELEQASWIADSGRFAEFLKSGDASEAEQYPGCVVIARQAIVDICRFDHPLPVKTK